jgi:hypothetical protein
LLPTYSGAIKFYSCHSGTKLVKAELKQEGRKVAKKNVEFNQALEQDMISQDQFDRFTASNIAPLERCLAAQGADYMRKHGHKKCTYYGGSPGFTL